MMKDVKIDTKDLAAWRDGLRVIYACETMNNGRRKMLCIGGYGNFVVYVGGKRVYSKLGLIPRRLRR
jgi:hypothetical protein